MDKVDLIVIHCSATRENQNCSLEDIDKMHKARGFSEIGYHLYVTRDGRTHLGRALNKQGAHSYGYNKHSWAMCYEGGLDVNGKPKDTRTPQQKQAILRAVLFLKGLSNNARVLGHRDLSKDLNNDGIIQPNEYIKMCPCFNAIEEYNF